MGLKRVLIMSVGVRMCVVTLAIIFVCFRYIWGVKSDTTLIIKAASEGNVEQVERLIYEGEYVSSQDSDGNSALHFCVYNGSYENNRKVIRILIKNQADVRMRNDAGQSPAHLIGHIDNDDHRMQVLGWLIKFGFNFDAEDNQDYTVLDKIVEQYDYNGVDLIIEQWGSLITPNMIKSAKKIAEKLGYRDLIKRFEEKIPVLGSNGNINAWNKESGLSGLHYAVIRGDESMVGDLIDKKAKIESPSRDEFGFMPIHFAVLHQKDTIVDLLLQRGANVNASAADGNTPLHLVAHIHNSVMNKKIADQLLKNGANIKSKNKNGDTLFHVLVRNNNKELIAFILKMYPFDTAIKNRDLETPLDIAKRLKRNDIVRLLT